MKNLKKLASLLLALVMVLSLSVSASATEGGELDPQADEITITIMNTPKGNTYSVYKILDVDSLMLAGTEMDDGNGGTIVLEKNQIIYTVDRYADGAVNPWYTFLTTEAQSYFVLDFKPETIEGEGNADDDITNDVFYVTWKGEDPTLSATTLSQLAIAFAKSNGIAPTVEPVTASGDTNTTIVVPELGYYLIDSSMGSHCALVTTQPDAELEAKNETHTIEKEVKPADEPETSFGETSHGYIGQTMNFRTIVNMGIGGHNLVIHDVLSEGLTLDKTSIKVYNGTLLLPANCYEVQFDVDHTAADADEPEICTFDVILKDSYVSTINSKPSTFTVTYDAVLNEKAFISNADDPQGNPNTTWLTYGDGHYTPEDTTQTYTWSIELFKFTNTDSGSMSERTPLAGATFSITTLLGTSRLHFIHDEERTETYGVNIYRAPDQAERTEETDQMVDTFTTDESGTFVLCGLDVGIYVVREIEAPPGFNRYTDPIYVIITETGSLTIAPEMDESNTPIPDTGVSGTGSVLPILNQAGSVLPQTGGEGTAMFYIVGGVLVLAAVVLLVTKRRMKAN